RHFELGIRSRARGANRRRTLRAPGRAGETSGGGRHIYRLSAGARERHSAPGAGSLFGSQRSARILIDCCSTRLWSYLHLRGEEMRARDASGRPYGRPHAGRVLAALTGLYTEKYLPMVNEAIFCSSGWHFLLSSWG